MNRCEKVMNNKVMNIPLMGTAHDSFALSASYLSACSLCPGISLIWNAAVSLKTDHLAYDVNIQWNNNTSLEEG